MNNEKNKKLWLKKCEETLKMGGRSEITVRNYCYAIERFLNSYNNEVKISKLPIDNIIKYFRKNFLDKNLSANTYNFNVASIRYFYLICFERNISKTLLPTSNIRKRFPSIITKEQFLNIINKETNLEHKCWYLLSFCCGLRISEIATLKIENINSKEHKLKVLGKGNKERYTILPDIVIKFLRLYCKQQHITNKHGYLFISHDSKSHINSKSIINYFSTLKVAYNLDKRISFHTLRHSFATYYLMNGGNVITLKSMLGHAHLDTTNIYLHIAQSFNNLEGIKYV